MLLDLFIPFKDLEEIGAGTSLDEVSREQLTENALCISKSCFVLGFIAIYSWREDIRGSLIAKLQFIMIDVNVPFIIFPVHGVEIADVVFKVAWTYMCLAERQARIRDL